MRNQKPEAQARFSHAGAIAPAPLNYYATRPRADVLIGLRASSPQERIDAALDHMIGDFARMLRRSRHRDPMTALAEHIRTTGRGAK